MIADRSQTASHIGLRRHDLGATPIAVSPETERVTASTSVQGTGCSTTIAITMDKQMTKDLIWRRAAERSDSQRADNEG
jgi:hypothetical protein